MFTVILISILLITAIAIFIIRPSYKERGEEYSLWWVGLIPLVIGVLVLIFSSTAIVQAKQVGVLTSFGKPSDRTLNSGLHLKAPWQKVTSIDATIQTNEYHGEDALKVILADKNTAEVSATIRWSVNRENANDVYADFRSDDPTDSLRKAVVSTKFKAAMNSVFNSYDATSEDQKSTSELAAEVQKILVSETEELVDIKSITISYIKPDKAVQRKIDALQTQRGATKVAEEKKKTVQLEADANRLLSNSISNDPNVLVSKCLDLIADGAFDPPAGFTCWPGGGGSVVIPSGGGK